MYWWRPTDRAHQRHHD